ncbi:MAG: ABC transporter permease [Candidatus Rokubacteria bacterium]|nr:ABC transporter permease [Candidatus Rokubacteria bacterium]
MRGREATVSRPSLLVWATSLLAFAYLVLPVLIVIPLSFTSSRYLQFPPPGWSLEWYATFFQDPVWIRSTLNSVKLGLAVAAVATIVGTGAAYGLVRGEIRGRRLLLGVLLSPMIVPAIVTAIALYSLYARLGLVGNFLGMVLAHTVLATPLVVVNVAAGLQRLDPVLERASMSLGAGPLRTFLGVVLPNILPGVLSGALFAFITSFDELVVVLFIGGNTMTLPRKIWEDLVVLVEPTQAAASTILIVVSTVLMGLWGLLQRRA